MWSLEFLFLPPALCATAPIFASLCMSIVRQQPFASDVWRKTYWVVIVQFLLFAGTITVAIVGWVDWQQPIFPGPNRLGLRIVNALSLTSLLLGVYWVWRMKGKRWFATSAALFQLSMLLGAGFVAGMALTGTWL